MAAAGHGVARLLLENQQPLVTSTCSVLVTEVVALTSESCSGLVSVWDLSRFIWNKDKSCPSSEAPPA